MVKEPPTLDKITYLYVYALHKRVGKVKLHRVVLRWTGRARWSCLYITSRSDAQSDFTTYLNAYSCHAGLGFGYWYGIDY